MFTKYMYLVGCLAFVPVFLYCFIKRPDLRKQMIVLGIAIGITGFTSEAVFFRDYWQPPLIFRVGRFGGPEDFIFGFLVGSLGSTLYELVFNKKHRSKYPSRFWILPVLIISEYCFVRYGIHHGLNSIYGSAFGLLLPAIIMVSVRHDLLRPALLSGSLFALALITYETLLLIFVPNYLKDYFLLFDKVPLIGKTPVTELVWGFCAGACISTFYKFYSGKTTAKRLAEAPTEN